MLLKIPAFAQTSTARGLINPSFSAILIINHTQWAQASIDGYVQGFREATFSKQALLPPERLHIGRDDTALRDGLVKVARQKAVAVGQGSMKDVVYEYVTGEEG